MAFPSALTFGSSPTPSIVRIPNFGSAMSEPRVHKCLRPRALRRTLGVAVIPCGQCAECLKSKANQLAVRVFREVQYRSPFHFVTLTYSPEHVPVWHNRYLIDRSTGELTLVYSGLVKHDFLRQMFCDNAPFEWVYNKKRKRVKRLKPYFYETATEFNELYYSVNYEDIKRSFKSWRMAYERLNGFKVDESNPFKMFIVPEYGSATYRPHYHICFVGLSRDNIEEFCRRWRERFGFTYVQRVVDVKGDSSDFVKVSSYLAKYANKGSYDCPYICQGYCIAPHRGFSRDFGIGDPVDFARRLAYWRCEDVYPDLDFNHPEDYPRLINPRLFAERRSYRIGKYPYPFPSYFKRRAFFHRVPDYAFSNPDKWTLIEDSVGELTASLVGGKTIFTQNCQYHYVPTNPKLRKSGKCPTKEVSTALQGMVATALLGDSLCDLLRESGLEVLPSAPSCDYRKGFAFTYRPAFDSGLSTAESLLGCPSVSSAVDNHLAEVSRQESYAAAVTNDFIRNLSNSLF